MITFDTRELQALSTNISTVAKGLTPLMIKTFRQGADDLVKTWAANARETSGVHGKHYPDSIDSEQVISTDIAFEVGPNPRKPQGKMAFESGSVNQPPHPDGARATDTVVPLLQRRIDATLAYLGL